jgi:hypothetical protein
MSRVYHPIHLWEEIKYNMWGDVDDRPALVQVAIDFTSNHELYGHWMLKVVEDWPISCENALTDYTINRKAWIGHAAVAYAKCIPEDITRQAWGFLTDEQRILANQKADRAIRIWELAYLKDKDIHQDMGGQMLFGWYT